MEVSGRCLLRRLPGCGEYGRLGTAQLAGGVPQGAGVYRDGVQGGVYQGGCTGCTYPAVQYPGLAQPSVQYQA